MGTETSSKIALLSLHDEADGLPSNHQMLGGASVLERQVDVALALGCGRIVLFAERQGDLAIKAQQMAENAGAQFRLIQRGRQLLGGLRQQDDLIVLAEGWLPSDADLLAALKGPPVLLRLPAAEGMKNSFERLDREYCWAGAMVLPGRVVERLEDLDDDIDPVSALVRAARSARVVEQDIPLEWLNEGRWSLRQTKLPARGPDLVALSRRSLLKQVVYSPIASRLLGRTGIIQTILACGVIAILGAFGALIYSLFGVSLLLSAFSGIALGMWLESSDHNTVQVFSPVSERRFVRWVEYVPSLTGIGALSLGLAATYSFEPALYIALLTMFVWVLAGQGSHSARLAFRDQPPLWLLLGIASFAGQLFVGAAILTAVAMFGILLNIRNQPAITQA